jgi:hypothetical protein
VRPNIFIHFSATPYSRVVTPLAQCSVVGSANRSVVLILIVSIFVYT